VLALGAAGLAAIGLVGFYDLQTAAAFGDEWVYRWTVQHAAATGHLTLWPAVYAASLVQYAVSIPVAKLTSDPRLLRLTVLPWAPVIALYSWRIARGLGAHRFQAAIAATLLICSPLYLSISTALLSDPAYLALLMAAVWYGFRWVRDGSSPVPMIAATALATLERQHGAGLAPAITLALIVTARSRRISAREWAWLAALWVVAAAAAAALPLSGLATSGMSHGLSRITHPSPANIAGGILELAPMLGLLLLPVAPMLWLRGSTESKRQSPWEMAPVALAVASVAAGAMLTFYFHTDILPGGNFGIYGLGPVFLAGDKPWLFPVGLFAVLELALTASYLVVLIRRRRLWTPLILGREGVWLVMAAASQLLLIPATIPSDKYYLAVIAPLVPLLLARTPQLDWASRQARATASAALALMAAGILLYAVGQQDHGAWAEAADTAARRAYQHFPPLQVDAGYEANGTYLGVPSFERTGRLPEGVDYFFVRPPHPQLVLRYAAAGDPRPGVSYSSIAPGKIIAVPPGD
jgi:hypothetical protein